MEWVDEKLIPTFKARFPSKKMILVLDNVPYHHCIEYELPTKKGDIVDYLREHGCHELKVWNLRSSLQGDYVMSGFQALCPIAFSGACGNSLNLI